MAWDSPSTLALLGASAGFLDPRVGGPAAGFRGAMEGMHAGNQIQQQRFANDELKNKLARKLEIENMLRQLSVQHGGDMVGMSKALTSSPYPELIKLGIDLAKAKTVRSYIKGEGPDGKPTYYAGYNTGELSPTGITPSEKLMQINRGSQIDLANPYTGDAQKSLGVGISPGQSAQLAQSQNQFNMSHALAQQNSALNQYKTMMDYNPEFQAQKAWNIAGAKVQATNRAQAAIDLPKVVEQGEQTIKLIDDLLKHPGFNISVGAKSPVGKVASFVPGTDAASFDIASKQMLGKQFLEAFETLKGGGQITEIEGEKATQAMSRMNTSNSQEEYIKSARELQDIIKKGINRTKQKAGVTTTESKPDNGGWSVQRID